MEMQTEPGQRFSRRALIGGVAATAFLTTAVIAQAQQPDLESLDAAGLLHVIRTSTDDEANRALVEVFARSGIAVCDDDIATVQTPLKAVPSPLTFAMSQITPMVEEIRAGAYQQAGTWNTLGPETTDAGEPLPGFADLYAAYGWRVPTPGGDFTRQFLWEMPIGKGSISADGLPLPRAAAAVMSGEILGQLQEQLEGLPTTIPDLPSIPSLPGLPNLPPLGKEYELPPLPELDGEVCGNVQGFVTAVIQRVLSVLENTRDVVTIPILDQIFAGLVEAIDFGLKVITRAIDIVITPVMGVLKSVAAAVAIASSVLGTVTPWTISAMASPDTSRLGIGPAEVISGEVTFNAGGADDIPWPAVVTNCASTLGLAVPKRASAGSPVAVEVANPSDRVLVELGNEERVLDTTGKLQILYVTTNESQAEIDKGEEEIGVVYITGTIDRDDLRQFSKHLVDLLLADLPTILATILRDLTLPIVDSLRESIVGLTVAESTTRMYVTYHRTHCLQGQFVVMNSLTTNSLGASDVAGGGGAMHWWFNSNGSCSMSWNGLEIAWADGGQSQFAGVAEGTFSVESGEVVVTFTSTNITEIASHPKNGQESYAATPAQLTELFGSWTLACGETIYMRNDAYGFVMWLAPIAA